MNTLMYEHEIAHCKKAIAGGAKGEVLKDAQARLKRAEAGLKAAQAEKPAAFVTRPKKSDIS